ncbi:hypothetical protein DFH29DRAFT_778037, partial [Suillus ampliporus]
LRPELECLLSNREEKEECFIYKTLLTDLLEQGYGIEVRKCLSIQMIGSMFYLALTINSYGPKGSAVFQATLNKLFNPQTDTINPDIFAPMTLDQYNQFMLILYIACHLITEDHNCDMKEAFTVMVASGDAGDELQAINDKDERFDDL